MRPTQRHLLSCPQCERFVEAHETTCSFCGSSITAQRTSSKLKLAALGLATAATLYGMSSLLGCAYGLPPCKSDANCASNEVCQEGICQAKPAENNEAATEQTPDAGGE